jgi:hypothetical protein
MQGDAHRHLDLNIQFADLLEDRLIEMHRFKTHAPFADVARISLLPGRSGGPDR